MFPFKSNGAANDECLLFIAFTFHVFQNEHILYLRNLYIKHDNSFVVIFFFGGGGTFLFIYEICVELFSNNLVCVCMYKRER